MRRRATVPLAAALLIFGCTCTDPKPALPPIAESSRKGRWTCGAPRSAEATGAPRTVDGKDQLMARTTAKLQTVEVGSNARQQSEKRAGRDAHIVILKSGDGYFGIDINIVQEIVLMQEITDVPGSASHIAGMTDLRGRVIPVTEFATLLAHEPSERNDDTRILVVEHGDGHIGFIVDAVTEVMLVDGEKIEDASSAGAQEHEFIVGVAKMEDHLVSLVDVERLLAAADRETETVAQAA